MGILTGRMPKGKGLVNKTPGWCSNSHHGEEAVIPVMDAGIQCHGR